MFGVGVLYNAELTRGFGPGANFTDDLHGRIVFNWPLEKENLPRACSHIELQLSLGR